MIIVDSLRLPFVQKRREFLATETVLRGAFDANDPVERIQSNRHLSVSGRRAHIADGADSGRNRHNHRAVEMQKDSAH